MSRRFPLAPLVAAYGLSEHQLGVKVGLSGSTLKAARERGLTADAADRYAIRAELHPGEVWGEGFGLPACEDCGVAFHGSRVTQRFCSLPCRRRSSQRQWRAARYANDPEFAERVRARRREFYKQCRDYELARQKHYDATVRAPRVAGKKATEDHAKGATTSSNTDGRLSPQCAVSGPEGSQVARGTVDATNDREDDA